MKELPHPFIVKIIDEFINSAGNLCLVQVLYNDGDFSKYLRQRDGKLFSENEILRFLANIIIVVYHINSKEIYHRDLKPENFLVKKDSNGRIYLHLNDFGIARSSIAETKRINTTTGNNQGSLYYIAPEILNAIKVKPDITKQDVWAIGVIAY